MITRKCYYITLLFLVAGIASVCGQNNRSGIGINLEGITYPFTEHYISVVNQGEH